MRRIKLISNTIIILSLLVMLLGPTSISAQAENEEPKADPRLLQMAAENPDAAFR